MAIWNRNRVFDWMSMVKILPLKDFLERLIKKCFYVMEGYLFITKYRLVNSGAKKLGLTPDGNALLQLKKNLPLALTVVSWNFNRIKKFLKQSRKLGVGH